LNHVTCQEAINSQQQQRQRQQQQRQRQPTQKKH